MKRRQNTAQSRQSDYDYEQEYDYEYRSGVPMLNSGVNVIAGIVFFAFPAASTAESDPDERYYNQPVTCASSRE